jgi:hypothetical protein
MKKFIEVTWQFEGLHCWPSAPDEVAFLRSPHRHIFHCRARLEVFHQDREVEFILLKRNLESRTLEWTHHFQQILGALRIDTANDHNTRKPLHVWRRCIAGRYSGVGSLRAQRSPSFQTPRILTRFTHSARYRCGRPARTTSARSWASCGWA